MKKMKKKQRKIRFVRGLLMLENIEKNSVIFVMKEKINAMLFSGIFLKKNFQDMSLQLIFDNGLNEMIVSICSFSWKKLGNNEHLHMVFSEKQ